MLAFRNLQNKLVVNTVFSGETTGGSQSYTHYSGVYMVEPQAAQGVHGNTPPLSVVYYCLKSLNISRLDAPVEVLNRHPGGEDVRRLMLLRVHAQPSRLSSLFSIAVLSSVYPAA